MAIQSPSFQTFSIEVQKKHTKFVEVKRRLWAKQITYAMLYPAKLRITDRDIVHFLENPRVVNIWLGERHKKERKD